MRLHDTATGRVRELDLRDPGRVSMYVCGPTVYDVPHIGHGRAALVYDVLRRYLEWSGVEVHHVSNITDVDDKIIARANREGRSAEEVAREYEAVWYDAVDALGVLRPTQDPHATDYVDGMVEAVRRLVERDAAYETTDGVYFNVERVEDYGLLARQALDSLRAGERVEVVEEKRSPLDFVLWKKAKPGEPAWDSPWGPGRPGWHTECVVMSLDLLGEGFDLHAGGLDLQFPHHENERAQAIALGHLFARHWMHHAFVETGGEKMSKSLANFTSLSDLLARTDPRAYRLLVLQSHYRSPMELDPEGVERAESSLRGIDELARRVAAIPATPDSAALDRFRAHMDDDLGTPAATAAMFELVTRANAALDRREADAGASAAAAALEMARTMGIEPRTGEQPLDEESARLVAERDAARRARDYARADAIRDELSARGWTVKDSAEGTRVHR
ncbi:MAG: cysteine--tRNA ligase [Actinomycetota bacterium]|nr:cysteine--tRNA ligase [Actinomycetota bacterium]